MTLNQLTVKSSHKWRIRNHQQLFTYCTRADVLEGRMAVGHHTPVFWWLLTRNAKYFPFLRSAKSKQFLYFGLPEWNNHLPKKDSSVTKGSTQNTTLNEKTCKVHPSILCWKRWQQAQKTSQINSYSSSHCLEDHPMTCKWLITIGDCKSTR